MCVYVCATTRSTGTASGGNHKIPKIIFFCASLHKTKQFAEKMKEQKKNIFGGAQQENKNIALAKKSTATETEKIKTKRKRKNNKQEGKQLQRNCSRAAK